MSIAPPIRQILSRVSISAVRSRAVRTGPASTLSRLRLYYVYVSYIVYCPLNEPRTGYLLYPSRTVTVAMMPSVPVSCARSFGTKVLSRLIAAFHFVPPALVEADTGVVIDTLLIHLNHCLRLDSAAVAVP